jgi:hypothetical protein
VVDDGELVLFILYHFNEVFSGYQPGKVVQFFLEKNVSKTVSVLVLRVVELMGVRWTTQSYLYLSKGPFSGPPFCHWGPTSRVIGFVMQEM